MSSVHLATLIISALIFLVGLLVGWGLGAAATAQLQENIQRLEEEQRELDVLALLAEQPEVGCGAYSAAFESFTRKTRAFGEKVEYLEKKKGKLDEEVLRLKSGYAILQARNYLILRKMNELCGESRNIILYFYTNENYSEATDQGIVLWKVIPTLPAYADNTSVYHFDVKVNNSIIEALKKAYGISVLPTLVVNGKKIEGFHDEASLRRALESVRE